MKYIIISTLMLVFTSAIIGQTKLRDNQLEGYIITAEGTKSEVAIEVEDASLPWTFQDDVKYYDRALLTGARVKRELKKSLIAGEIIEYGFANRRFIHVSYFVKGKGDDVLKSTMDKIKGEKNTDFFAEIIRDGKIQLLKFYWPPDISDEDYDDDAIVNKITTEAKESFDILIAREGHKAKSIQEINYKNFFEDCPFVVNKFENKRYKFTPTSGIKKLLKSDGLSGAKLETASIAVLDDYISKCQK
jgi:hypothetical protein